MPFSAYALPLSVLLALGALLSAWRAARPGQGFGIIRQTDAAHLFMNASMAVMLTPWYGTWLSAIITALYALLALAALVLLGWALRRPGPARTARVSTYAYHLLVTLAMLYIISVVPPAPASMAGMAPASLLAKLIGLAFLLDAVVTAVTVTFFPSFATQAVSLSGEDPHDISIFALREGAIAHVIMDFGMIFMVVVMAG